MAKLVVYIPVEAYQPLCAHVAALRTTISERARALLLADMEKSAPPTAPEIEQEKETV